MSKRRELAIEIAKEIKHEMYRRGWSQSKLGKEIGINRHNASRLLSGQQPPSWKALLRIAEAFGLDVQVRLIVQPEDTNRGPAAET